MKQSSLPRGQFLRLAVLVCGSFVTLLNQTLITPALSTIMVEFSVDTATVQWLVNGFTMVNAIMIPITAFLLEKYTTRRLFIVSMLIFLAGTALAAWGPGFLVLLGGRLLQAAGAGIIMPMVMTELMISFPPEKRGEAMGVFGLVNAVAPTIGPTLSGIIIDITNWHMLFALVCVMVVFGIGAAFTVLKGNSLPINPEAQLDKPSVVSSSLGFGLVLYGFSTIGSVGFSIPVGLSLLVGIGILVYFFRRQLSMENPMLRIDILKNKRFAVSTILTVIIQSAIMCAPVLVPIYIQTIRGFSATTSGLTLMPGAILMAIANPLVGKLFDKHGPRALCIGGGIAMLIGTVALCFMGLDTPLWVLTVFMAFRQVAISFLNMPISTWGMNALDDSLMNHGTSVSNTARMVAGSLGTAVIVSASSMASSVGLAGGMGNAEAQLLGFNAAFAISAAICAICFVLCVVYVKDSSAGAAAADVTGERRNLLEQIMKRDVFSVSETATVHEAATLFVERNISAAPIVTPQGTVVGFISDGDILRVLSSSNKDQEFIDPIMMMARSMSSTTPFTNMIDHVMEQPVTSIAHMGVISVDVHDRLSYVCHVMGENHLKKVPVLEDGKIVGVINRSDITKYTLGEYMRSRETLLARETALNA